MNMSDERRKEIIAIVSAIAAVLAVLIALIALLYGDGLLKNKLVLEKEDVNNINVSKDIIEQQENDYDINNEGLEEKQNIPDNTGEKKEIIDEVHEELQEDLLVADDPTATLSDYISGIYNSSEITIYTEVRELIENYNGTKSYMGVVPEEDIQMTIYLKDYADDELVEVQKGKIGQEVIFSDIDNGTYYYEIESEGFNNLYGEPFTIQKDESEDDDLLKWIKQLEQSDTNYSSSFRIQIVDDLGNPVKNTETRLRVVDNNNMDPHQFTMSTFYSNDDGYLTSWENINGKDYYYIVDFNVAEGFCIQVEDSNEIFQTVSFSSDGIGIVIY